MTPFEAWTRKKPIVGHLRVFGCDAYAHISKDERHKLDSKARKCILLGYGKYTKRYWLYDPKRGKVIYGRDVQFNETERVAQQQSIEHETKQHVELDFTSDSAATIDTSQNEAPSNEVEEPALRRSEGERQPPDYYGARVNAAHMLPKDPVTIEDALTSPDKSKWRHAMEMEVKSLKENDVWELVELPKDRKAVGSKWVYKIKTSADGTIERYKARLVAQGFSQKFGTDYDETFCPVVRLESLRTLISLSVQCGLKHHLIGVTTAFLNGELEEEVYMKQPKGFIANGQEHLVCKLKESIYGLKQSPRCWNAALDNQLMKIGFVQAASELCIYMDSEGEIYQGVCWWHYTCRKK